MAIDRQSSALPPAQPTYILRGHTSQLHSVQFVRRNTRLLTGDADGWLVLWKLETKRALAVWKAHDAAILGTAEWAHDNIITHGRDNTLRIWQLRSQDENAFSTILPADDQSSDRPKPWLLHTLPVNTLNFCAFSACTAHPQVLHEPDENAKNSDSILIAVPARDDKKIEVYQFPEERLRYVTPRVQSTDTGMAMAVKLFYDISSNSTLVLAGYEGGITAVYRLPELNGSTVSTAELVYLSQPHSQPVLSLDIVPETRTYFTSSADAIIAAHRIPDLAPASNPPAATGSASDDRILEEVQNMEEATSRLDEPSEDHLHNEPPGEQPPRPTQTSPTQDINPPLSFAKQPVQTSRPSAPAGLSSLLSSTPSRPTPPIPTPPPPLTLQPPNKTTNTKHSGQQSLTVRSDGRIFATGGWDSRIRIYSTKTLKEVAVLKWHKEGVYAVSFSQILSDADSPSDAPNKHDVSAGELSRRETGLSKLQRQREDTMSKRHWIVGGAKDGKVSLWEVF